MKTFIRKIHLWLAIPTGLIIVILCATGVILSFQNEILEIVYPQRYFIKNKVENQKLPLSKLIPIVNNQLEDNEVSSIKISSDEDRTYLATLKNGFRISAFIDPYTGQIITISNFREGFFFKIMSLHRWLLDGTRTWGKYITGVTTLCFVLILISGMIWWIPSKKKQLKSKLIIKRKYGLKRFFYDCHMALGIYASLFLLICCLTGLMWSFDWYRNSVYRLFGTKVPVNNKHIEKKIDVIEINYSIWDQAVASIKSNIGQYDYLVISDGEVSVLPISAQHLRALDKYSFDKETGNLLETRLYKNQDKSRNIMTWAYIIHIGAYGGIITRILTCLASFIGATLPLTGYYLWWRKRKKKRKIPI